MKMRKPAWFFAPAVFFTAISSLMQVLVAFLMKLIIDCAMEGNAGKLMDSVRISLIYIAVYFTANYLREVFIAGYIKTVLTDLKSGIYNSVMKRDYKSFYRNDSGEYLSNLTNDITVLEENYYKSKFIIIQSLVTFIFAVISLFVISWKFAAGVLLISVLFMALSGATGMGLNTLRAKLQESLSGFTSVSKDLLGGFEVIRAFNAHEKVRNEFDAANGNLEKNKFLFNLRMGIIRVVNENLVILIMFSIMTLGSWFVITGEIGIGSLLAVIQLLNGIMMPVNLLLQALNTVKSTENIREKMAELLSEAPETQKTAILAENFTDEVTVKNLSFSYDGKRKILDGLDFRFEKGKKYAVTGESGCGKSTLLKLIQNYYDDYEGDILLDGINYKNIEGNSFFSLFSVTQQNVFMFRGTIRDNITLFNESFSDKALDAARSSGLSKLLNTLPEGLDTVLGENGGNLSGGEKQRISLARALLRNTPLLILDEFTSALDKETSETIEREVLSLKDQTVITVTHRLTGENRKYYDYILEMKNGKIAKVTSSEETVRQKNIKENSSSVEKKVG